VSADRAGRLRDAYQRASREDIDGFLTVIHDDVVWTEQVLPDKKVERGDDAVVEVRVRTTGLASGVAVEASVLHVIRFRDERIATITALFDRDEALRAAGLG
jgi:ketosteroid isomerase-like protein